jgi:hypothetical protein
MLRRTFCVVTLFALVFGVAGLGTAPVVAAPPAAAAAAPNATLLPPDTALYVNFHVADLDNIVNFLLDTVQKVSGFRPGDPYADLDRGLTEFLGRDATFKKDVQAWLGDDITFAFRVTDQQLADLSTKTADEVFRNPEALVIISVKDDAAAAAFLKEVMAKAPEVKFNTRTVDLPGGTVTVYDQSGSCTPCGSLFASKGYIALGTTASIDAMTTMLKDRKPSFGSDATVGKLMAALKPNTQVKVYLASRFYQLYASSMQAFMPRRPALGEATPEAGAAAAKLMKAMLDLVKGQAFGLRMDGKVLAMDVAQSVDLKAAAKLFTDLGLSSKFLQNATPKAIDAKLAGQIPDKALAVAIGGGLPNLYDALKEGVKLGAQFAGQMGARNQFTPEQIEAFFTIAESAIKAGLNVDLRSDILSWMNGEFALYVTYNPASVLTKVGRSPVPLDFTFLAQTSDAAKTKSFLAKLNTGLEKTANLNVESAGADLYIVTVNKQGITIGYGLVGNTFILTTGSGLNAAVAAVKGDGVLSKSAVWTNARASMVKPTAAIGFINFVQIATVAKELMGQSGGSQPGAAQMAAVLDLLESATVSGGMMQPDGLSTSSFQIILK